ncbi:MAG TPA: hypothetical protein VHB25_04885 [Gemmatimonadaceae bacterium]|nr:hypothetical protein [Gemmatimonadaceae bacterium]
MIVGSVVAALLLQLAAPVGPAMPTPLPDTGQTSPAHVDTTTAEIPRAASVTDARLVPDWTQAFSADTNPRRRRPHAVELSDAYYTRLEIHRYAAWAEFPVFGAEWWLGQKLIASGNGPGAWVRPTHAVVAGALGGLFAVNTVTGVWNLWDSRQSTDDRALVWTHSALMLAADAGFAITGALAHGAHTSISRQNQHRNAALVSMSLATAGTLLMWVKRGF